MIYSNQTCQQIIMWRTTFLIIFDNRQSSNERHTQSDLTNDKQITKHIFNQIWQTINVYWSTYSIIFDKQYIDHDTHTHTQSDLMLTIFSAHSYVNQILRTLNPKRLLVLKRCLEMSFLLVSNRRCLWFWIEPTLIDNARENCRSPERADSLGLLESPSSVYPMVVQLDASKLAAH